MTTIDYLISTALILLVIPQIRGSKMTMISVVRPVVLVAAAAAYYLRAVPTQGNDVLLDVLLIALGTALGVSCAATTRITPGEDGTPYAKAGVAAGVLWVLGMAARFAFQYYANHSGTQSVINFSIKHQITGTDAWTAALIFMALAEVVSRLIVMRVRGRLLTGGARRTATVG
jgi:hypothetical protein